MLIIARGQFLKNVPYDIVVHNIWPMALIALVTLTASTWFFRHASNKRGSKGAPFNHDQLGGNAGIVGPGLFARQF